MNPLSRRDFFKKFTHDAVDQVDFGAAKAVLETVLVNSHTESGVSKWVVGRLVDFVPGAERKLTVGTRTLTIHSCGDGIWAERDDGKRVAMRAEARGIIVAEIENYWPQNRMLSHLTGEPKDVDVCESREKQEIEERQHEPK